MSDWQPVMAELMQQRYGALVGRARLLAPAQQDAEDLVQDALISTFSTRAKFASVSEAERYVRKAIVSRFIDKARRTKREKAALRAVGAPSPLPGPESAVASPVVAALSLLSPRQRACVVLRHLEDLSVHDTAATLGLSQGTVKRYTAEAVAVLNKALGTQFQQTNNQVGEVA